MITSVKKLELIQKHGKKFTDSKSSNLVLQGIHYAENGSVYANNRHYILRFRNAHTFTEPFTSHAVTGAKIDEKYPDIEKVFPTSVTTEFVLRNLSSSGDQIKNALHYAKWAHDIAKVGDKFKRILLMLESQSVVISVKQELVEFKAWFAPYEGSERFTMILSGEYLLNALQLFKDAGTIELRVRMKGKHDPLLLTDEQNEIDVLICPFRTCD